MLFGSIKSHSKSFDALKFPKQWCEDCITMTTNSVVDGSDVLIVSEEIDDEVKIIIPPILTSWTRRLMVLEKSMIKTEYEMACLNTLGGAFAATGRNFGALILSHKREKVAKGSPLGSQSLTMRARLHQAINLGLLGAVHEARAVVKGVIRTARQDGDIEVVIHARNSFNWLCSELERKGLFKRVCTGKISRINKSYSLELWTIVKLMLNVNPKQRPDCNKLLDSNIIKQKTQQYLNKQ